MKPKTYGLSKKRTSELKQKALELSVKRGDFVKESEIIGFLLDKYLNHVEIKDGNLHIDL